GQDVDAVGVLIDHALQAPDLAFDAAQALEHRVLVVAVAGSTSRSHAPTIPPYGMYDSCASGACSSSPAVRLRAGSGLAFPGNAADRSPSRRAADGPANSTRRRTTPRRVPCRRQDPRFEVLAPLGSALRTA